MTQTAENSTAATTIVGRPFPKGTSGNPGGRPRGLASYVREQTLDGEELVDFMLSVMRGEKVGGLKPTMNNRMEATTWLADRGFGKSLQQSRVEVDDNRGGMREELSAMTLAQVLQIREDLVEARDALPEAQVIDGEVVEGEIRDPA